MMVFKTKERRLFAKVFVTVVSFGWATIDWYSNRDTQGYNPTGPYTVALLMVLAELVLELHYLHKEKAHRDEEDLADKVEIFGRSNGGVISKHLHVVHDMIRATLTVDLIERAFTVRSRSQAIDTYHEYWAILVDEQKKIFESYKGKGVAGKGFKVRAIHRTSIDIWLGTSGGWQADAILRSHREFVSYGGVVERILVHKDAQPNEDYLTAIKRMKDCEVSVRYLCLEPTKWRNHCKWDFMLVGFQHNDTKDDAVIWTETDNEGNPMTAIYSCKPTYNDENLTDTWKFYHKESAAM